MENGNPLLAIVFVILALLMNLSKIQDFIDSKKKKKIDNLKEAVKNDHIKGLTKSHLENLIEKEYFKFSTGIDLEREFREALIALHQSTDGEVRFAHFKRAIPHLSYKNHEIIVNVTLFEKILFAFNLLSSVVIGFYGAVLFILPSLVKDQTVIQIITMFALGAFFVGLAMFMMSQVFPVVSANIIKSEIAKLKAKT